MRKPPKDPKKFNEFLKNVLEMDPDDIEVANIHSLPQPPQSRKGVRVNRPIIVKLSHAMNKKQIFSNLKKLKSFSTMRRTANKSTMFVTEHLSKVFLQQKKLLMPQFKIAKENKQKTSWRAEDGEYVLYVDNEKVVHKPSSFSPSIH